jgi:2-isopropylmalate synthase
MYSQGVDPGLDFSDIDGVREVYERCTRMKVHPRHPYAGELVFTAFSGSHQDAINKGMAAQRKDESGVWDVPYLPIDPKDIGRSYEAIIRINAQSGKGGVAYVMEQEFGFQLPKAMHPEFGQIINNIADARGDEISSLQIRQVFEETYLASAGPFRLEGFQTQVSQQGRFVSCQARIAVEGAVQELHGQGNGPIDALVDALRPVISPFTLLFFAEHSLQRGASAQAVAYIQIETPQGQSFFGAGIDTNIEWASLKAVLSALNRAVRAGRLELKTPAMAVI